MQEISNKHGIQGVAWFVLVPYSKMRGENDKIKGIVKQKGTGT